MSVPAVLLLPSFCLDVSQTPWKQLSWPMKVTGINTSQDKVFLCLSFKGPFRRQNLIHNLGLPNRRFYHSGLSREYLLLLWLLLPNRARHLELSEIHPLQTPGWLPPYRFQLVLESICLLLISFPPSFSTRIFEVGSPWIVTSTIIFPNQRPHAP